MRGEGRGFSPEQRGASRGGFKEWATRKKLLELSVAFLAGVGADRMTQGGDTPTPDENPIVEVSADQNAPQPTASEPPPVEVVRPSVSVEQKEQVEVNISEERFSKVIASIDLASALVVPDVQISPEVKKIVDDLKRVEERAEDGGNSEWGAAHSELVKTWEAGTNLEGLSQYEKEARWNDFFQVAVMPDDVVVINKRAKGVSLVSEHVQIPARASDDTEMPSDDYWSVNVVWNGETIGSVYPSAWKSGGYSPVHLFYYDLSAEKMFGSHEDAQREKEHQDGAFMSDFYVNSDFLDSASDGEVTDDEIRAIVTPRLVEAARLTLPYLK